MRNVIILSSIIGSALVVGCATEAEDVTTSDESTVKGADSGTYLHASAVAGAQECLPDGNVMLPIEGILMSTASGAWADVTLSIDGGAATAIDEVLPTDWSKDGRTKTFDYSYDVELSADATHTVEICFIQPSGKTRMTACATVTVQTQACSTEGNTCASHVDGPFGDTVGNHNLCHGKLDNNIEIQVKGDFGDAATVTVSGPNGYGFTEAIARSGNSCVYHYNWATRDGNNGGAGGYTITVEGNGQSETWSATLFCL